MYHTIFRAIYTYYGIIDIIHHKIRSSLKDNQNNFKHWKLHDKKPCLTHQNHLDCLSRSTNNINFKLTYWFINRLIVVTNMRPISVKFKYVFKYLHQIQYIPIGCKTRGSKEPVSLSCIFHNANVLENHNYKELTHNFSYVHVFVNLILLLIFPFF